MEQNLRILSVRFEPSGTIHVLNSTKLYKGCYGFVLLRAYVPVTPNRTVKTNPLCTVHGVVTDSFGNRVQITDGGKKKYWNMRPVEITTVKGFDYLIFERTMPKPLTDTVGELDLVYNYWEITKEGKLASRLTTKTVPVYVDEGGEADGEIDVELKNQEAAQICANAFAIERLNDDVEVLDQLIRDKVGRLWTTTYSTIAAFCANDPKVYQVSPNDTVLLSTHQLYMYYSEWDGVEKPPTDPTAYRAETVGSYTADDVIQSTYDLPVIGTAAGITYDTISQRIDAALGDRYIKSQTDYDLAQKANLIDFNAFVNDVNQRLYPLENLRNPLTGEKQSLQEILYALVNATGQITYEGLESKGASYAQIQALGSTYHDISYNSTFVLGGI
jgi:hypothetical protein